MIDPESENYIIPSNSTNTHNSEADERTELDSKETIDIIKKYLFFCQIQVDSICKLL